MLTVKMLCEGKTALLMEPMPEEVLESLRTGVRLTIDKNRSAKDVAAGKIYTNGDGKTPVIPAENLWSCLVEAGTLVAYKGKKNISTKEESLLGGLLQIEERYLPLQNGHDITWTVDKRRGRLPDGTAVCLVRPRFEHWGFAATLLIDESKIGQDKLRELVETAGTFKGLGGHRKKGPFGRFKIVNWEVIGVGKEGAGASKKAKRS